MAQALRLEVCVDAPAGLLAAVEGGADRIELCSALALGGLTPTAGAMRLAARVGRPVMAMIRPHPGPFHYGQADLDVMRRDIDQAREAGLAGVVFGANRPDGALDVERLALLARHAHGLGLTLHRAFDLAPDQPRALEEAVELGFDRILTSGGAPTAPLGAGRIAALVARAAGRIGLLAGSGVTAANVGDLVRRTGVREVHGSCGGPAGAPGLDEHRRALAEALGFITPRDRQTDVDVVAALRRALDKLGDGP